MANRLYQGVIHQMKDAINRTVGIIDESGVIVACSDPRLVGESRQGVREELSFSNDAAAFNGFTYRFISIGGKNEGIVFVEGDDAEAVSHRRMRFPSPARTNPALSASFASPSENPPSDPTTTETVLGGASGRAAGSGTVPAPS